MRATNSSQCILLDAEEQSGVVRNDTIRQSIGHEAGRLIHEVDMAIRALVRAEGQLGTAHYDRT